MNVTDAKRLFSEDADAAAGRAHVLEKLIGYERRMGRDTSDLERVCSALYGEDDGPSDAQREARNRRREYARLKRREEQQDYIDAIHATYPDVTVSMAWSRKHGRKVSVELRGAGFGPRYTSSERYGEGDPEHLIEKMPSIVRSLREKLAASRDLDSLIECGKLRKQGGFVVLPCSESHRSYDRRFGGIPLSRDYDSVTSVLAAVRKFLDSGEFAGTNAYGK